MLARTRGRHGDVRHVQWSPGRGQIVGTPPAGNWTCRHPVGLAPAHHPGLAHLPLPDVPQPLPAAPQIAVHPPVAQAMQPRSHAATRVRVRHGWWSVPQRARRRTFAMASSTLARRCAEIPSGCWG